MEQIDHYEGKFVFYPTNYLVAIIDQPDQAQAAIESLHTAGYSDEQIDILFGEEGAKTLDVDGKEHGLLSRIARFVQQVGDVESTSLKTHHEALKSGKVLLGVKIESQPQEAEVRRTAQLLKQYDAHDAYFYSADGVWDLQ